MFVNVDEQKVAGVIGILIAHLGAFGSGELIKALKMKKKALKKTSFFLSLFSSPGP